MRLRHMGDLLWVAVACTRMGAFGAAAQDYPTAPFPPYPDVKLIIVVPERNNGEPVPDPVAETTLIQAFVGLKYAVVDQKQYAATRYGPEMQQVVDDPTGQAARALINSMAGDILVCGSAKAEYGGKEGGVASSRATIALRVVATRGEGEILAATTNEATGAAIEPTAAGAEALQKAAEAAAASLVPRIAELTGGPGQATEEHGPASDGKPCVAVLRFKDPAQWAQTTLELGMQVPRFVTRELTTYGRFRVVEMNQVEDLKELQGSFGRGFYEDPVTKQRTDFGALKRPDLVILGSVTQADVDQRAIVIPVLGQVTQQKVTVGVYLSLVDPLTGEVRAASEGTGDDTSRGIIIDYGQIRGGTAAFEQSGMAKAMREAVAKTVKSVVAALPIRCPACGEEVPGTAKFCNHCGATICSMPTKCPKCKADVPPGSNFCPNCNAPISPQKGGGRGGKR